MVRFAEIENTLVVEVQEKVLDARSAKEFRREVEKALESRKQVVFDLSSLVFVDSSGLGTLLSCLRQVSNNGGDLKLCALTSQVRAVFQLVRMHRLFDIYNTREEAIQAFHS
jgi:anti-sigma B factor antagonist